MGRDRQDNQDKKDEGGGKHGEEEVTRNGQPSQPRPVPPPPDPNKHDR